MMHVGTQLIEAVEQGRFAQVAELLSLGADVDARDALGRTPLHAAFSEGNHNVVSLLLGRGADLGAVDHDGFTALHWAVCSDDPALVALAARPQLDALDVTDRSGRTPLVVAVTQRSVRAAAWLLEHGADPNLADADGWLALHHAAAIDLAELAPALVRAGSILAWRSAASETALDVARRVRATQIAAILDAAS